MSRKLALLILLPLLVYASHAQGIKLVKTWIVHVKGKPYSIAIDGLSRTIGVAGKCAYLLNSEGKEITKVCPKNDTMSSVSSCCGIFVFLSFGAKIYIIKNNGTVLWKGKFSKEEYHDAVLFDRNGLLFCGRGGCYHMGLKGKEEWRVYASLVLNAPAESSIEVRGRRIPVYYIPDIRGRVIIVTKGLVIDYLVFDEPIYSVATCKDLLAVSGKYNVYLYNISEPFKPKLLWKRGGLDVGFQVAFSPDCKYLVVTNVVSKDMRVFDVNGNEVAVLSYVSEPNCKAKGTEIRIYTPLSVAWRDDLLIIGYREGQVIAFKVEYVGQPREVEKEVVVVPRAQVSFMGVMR